MELFRPTKDQIMEFFKTHNGYITTYRISQLLVTPHVQRSTPMDEEWQHIQGFLHQLKSQDFLLVQNEGENIYDEKFSATADRVERYFNKNEAIDPSNFKKMTDDELRNIMRQTINNSHSSASDYHKAKLELDFRKNQQKSKQRWWEKTWVQLIFLIGALAGIVGLIALFK